jgi:hypothetical protein
MPNISRWFNYAKARIDSAIGQGHRDLDELEAQREAELADRPWLASDTETPTFDEARARIEWEAEQAARRAGRDAAPERSDGPGGPTATASTGPAPSPTTGASAGPAPADTAGDPEGAFPSPEERAAAAEAAGARLELEARQRESAARLDAIRAELGIDPPDEETP